MAAYTRNPQTIPDDSPGGSTVRQGVKDQNSQAIDDLYSDLNGHTNNNTGLSHAQIDQKFTQIDDPTTGIVPKAEEARDKAEEWATNPVDDPVETSPSNLYSALHHATKASISETNSKISENNAKSSETNAAASETTAISEANRAKAEADSITGLIPQINKNTNDISSLESEQEKKIGLPDWGNASTLPATLNLVQQAASDGYLHAMITASVNNPFAVAITGSDGSVLFNNAIYIDPDGSTSSGSAVCIPVMKDEYFKVTASSGYNLFRFIPVVQ